VVTGDASISYSGAQHLQDVRRRLHRFGVGRDVSIFIDGRATGKIGAIYAGGYNSVVEGKATVTFTNNSGLYNNLRWARSPAAATARPRGSTEPPRWCSTITPAISKRRSKISTW
jgi:hypothetical protein